ncbi:SIMPL domain-containing protein [Cellulosimicrobium sp. 72-3]|uniref:SIMPL domain-containing protein n=1 Tax=Cellulosimicrobium sp. 72-3 TaxID=2731680 RepID=UPI00148EB3E3|nr:SIMPL domain-containing protein [Cellulosimicrobium sp. 72-3]
MNGSGVTTTGQGAVTATPDVAVVELGAEASAPGVQDALDRANAGLAAARDALVAHGVAPSDLRTSQTSTWTEQREDGPRTTARLTLRATLRDVGASGEVVRAALDAAGPTGRLDSTSLAVGDPAPLAAAAREAAFADARARAKQYARLAGRSLGPVVEIREDDGAPGPVARALAAKATSDVLVVEPGSQEVRATVTVRWELADPADRGPASPTA